jgi:MFS family permease
LAKSMNISHDKLISISRPGAVTAWRWAHVGLAALAMVATLPGRTHGLGLFTEPILRSLHLDRESYGFLNLWATLLGGLFCLPCGWLIDRLGTRAMLSGVMIALGAVVVAMSGVQGNDAYPLTISLLPWGSQGADGFTILFLPILFVFLLLTRGLGQSALSVASLSLIGRSAGQRTGLAMGVYACLTSLGFTLAFGVLRKVVGSHPDDWRPVWAGIGLAVLAAGAVCGLLVRGRLLDADAASAPARTEDNGAIQAEWSLTLGRALRSPAFWTFSLAISFFGMVSSGTALFNESILAERGFPKMVFLTVTLLGIPIGLASNLLGGWLATRWPLPRLLAVAMSGLALALLAFPHVATEMQVYLYAAVLAAAGGLITVCFFTVWRRGFGPAHLGQIQGAAQMLTVLFSALGPQLFASAQARLGSYLPLFYPLAGVSLALGLASWFAALPGDRRFADTLRRSLPCPTRSSSPSSPPASATSIASRASSSSAISSPPS